MKILKSILKSVLLILISFLLFSSITVVLLRWINPPTTAFIQQAEDSSFLSLFKNDEKIQKWIPIKSISKEILFAVVASEDQRFFDHYGFDYVELKKAMEAKIKGKKERGASTITQQVAKNLFLFPTKSFLRKGVELYYTLIIELVWDKKRILEVYLNIAQFGDKIFGVEAASNYYFNKPAQFLSENESAELIAILPNPIKYNLKNKSKKLLNRIEIIKQKSIDIKKGKTLEIINR
jgi:monofunctional biosynthetic peptidoglycan transglycosylase